MRLAREFHRPDWRRMLAGMSSTELTEWGNYYREHLFSDHLFDSHFACLRHLIVSVLSSKHSFEPSDFSLLSRLQSEPEDETEMSGDMMMAIAQSMSGGVRYGPGNDGR